MAVLKQELEPCPIPFPQPSSPATASAPRSSTPRWPRSTRWGRPSLGPPGRRARPACRPPGDPLPAGHAGQHPPHAPGAEGPAGNALGRRLPLVERAPARGVPALRQPASGAHHHPGRALRQDRPGRGPREPRRPLHRPRALRPDRRRPARGGDGHRHQHRARAAAACSSSPSSTRSRPGARRSRSCTRPTS